MHPLMFMALKSIERFFTSGRIFLFVDESFVFTKAHDVYGAYSLFSLSLSLSLSLWPLSMSFFVIVIVAFI